MDGEDTGRLVLEQRDNGRNRSLNLIWLQPADAVQDYGLIRREQPIRPDVTRLAEVALFKVIVGDQDGNPVTHGLARDLSQEKIVSTKVCQHQSGSSFRLREIREGERDYYDVTSYKSRQAASSSGLSQSFAKEASLRRVALEAPSRSPAKSDVSAYWEAMTPRMVGFGRRSPAFASSASRITAANETRRARACSCRRSRMSSGAKMVVRRMHIYTRCAS